MPEAVRQRTRGVVRVQAAANRSRIICPARRIVPGPVTCNCCDESRLSKLGKDISETLLVIILEGMQHVRGEVITRRSTRRQPLQASQPARRKPARLSPDAYVEHRDP
jgi:hypothetical protein